MKNETVFSYDQWVADRLSVNPNLAKEYLGAVLENSIKTNDNHIFLNALRQVAISQGMARVAKSAGVRRESLSRALSAKGNPRMDTLFSIISAMGLELTLSNTI